ncbi:MAG: Ig-like domain-containing protein [Lachnospiraceae bacterium]|nr:Ig-like domain-containing protein [Lachnospiraceae bacterium]
MNAIGNGSLAIDGEVDGPGTLNVGMNVTVNNAVLYQLNLTYTGTGSFFAKNETGVSDSDENELFVDLSVGTDSYGLFVGFLNPTYSINGELTVGTSTTEMKELGSYKSFVLLVSSGTHTLTSQIDGSSTAAIGSYEQSDNVVKQFTVDNKGVNYYYKLQRVLEPTFWQAHYTDLSTYQDNGSTYYSATLTAEVDRVGESELLVGSDTITERGFRVLARYKINEDSSAYDSKGNLNYTVADDGTVSGSVTKDADFVSYDIQVSIPEGDNGRGVYTAKINGLEEGYVYVIVPYVKTGSTEYLANRADTFNGGYWTLSDKDDYNEYDPKITIALAPKTWPTTMELTYGDAISDIEFTDTTATFSELASVYQYITFDDGDITTPLSILHDSSLTGTFSFEVYKSYDETTGEFSDKVTDTYLDVLSGDSVYYVQMTFTPTDTARYSTATSGAIELTVNPRPVAVADMSDGETNVSDGFTKTYDGNGTFTTDDMATNTLALKALRASGSEYVEMQDNTLDTTLQALLESAIDDTLTMTATASSTQTASNADKSGNALDSAAGYPLTISSLSFGGTDAANYTYIASENSENVYGWIKQKEIQATWVINAANSDGTYLSATSVLTGQKFYVTAELADGYELVGTDALDTLLAGQTVSVGGTSYTYNDDSNTAAVDTEGSVAVASKTVTTDNYEITVGEYSLTVNQDDPWDPSDSAEDYNFYYDGQAGDNGYYIEPVMVTPYSENGYNKIKYAAVTNGVTGAYSDWSDGLLLDKTGTHTYSIILYNDVTGAYTSAKTITVVVDTESPKITAVTITKQNGGSVASVLNKLTFGLFFNEKITVTVTVKTDGVSPLASYTYSVDGTEMTVNFSGSNLEETFSFSIDVDQMTSTGEVKFSAKNLAGMSSGDYKIEYVEASGDDPASYDPVAMLEGESGTIIVVEDTAPTIDFVAANDSGTVTKTGTEEYWFTEDVNVTITFTDPLSGTTSALNSGIASYTVTKTTYTSETEYVTDPDGKEVSFTDKDEKTSSATYTDTISADAYKVVYTVSATDNAGNTSGEKTYTVYRDATSPTLSGSATAKDRTDQDQTVSFTESNTSETVNVITWTDDAISVSLTAEDSTSGLQSIDVSRTINGTTTTDTTVTMSGNTDIYTDTISANGTYVYTVTDKAGLTTTKTFVVEGYDSVDPAVSGVSYLKVYDGDNKTASYNAGEWSDTTIRVTVEYSDIANADEIAAGNGNSGLAVVGYSYDGFDGEEYTVTDDDLGLTDGTYSFEITETGTYANLKVWVIDQAGNKTEYSTNETLYIDTVDPSIAVTAIRTDADNDTATYDASTGWGSDSEWTKNGETLTFEILNQNTTTATVTWQVKDTNDQNYVNLETWADSHGAIVADSTNGTGYTLTFSTASYEGTLSFRLVSENGNTSVSDANYPAKISVESFEKADVNALTVLDPTVSSGAWYDKDGLTITVSGMKSADNSVSTQLTPGNDVTTTYSLRYYADEAAASADTSRESGTQIWSGSLVYYGGASSSVGFAQDGESAAYTLPSGEYQSGVYVLSVSVKDTAGNEQTADEVVIKLDTEAPTLGSVQYLETGATNFLQNLINKLSFGVFYKTGVKVLISATDTYSTVDQVYYVTSSDGSTWDYTDPVSATYSDGTYNFTLTEGTTGYIKYWAVDKAGNVSAKYNLGYDLTNPETDATSESSAVLWQLESGAPEISSFSATDGTNTIALADSNTDGVLDDAAIVSVAGSVQWMTDSATLTAAIQDSGSGLYSVTAIYQHVDTFADINSLDSAEEKSLNGVCYDSDGDDANEVKLGSDTDATDKVTDTVYYKAALTEEGVYKITLTATDNAANTISNTIYVYVDSVDPVISINYDDNDQEWINKDDTTGYIVPKFTVTEATSGIATVVVKADSTGVLGYESDNTTKITEQTITPDVNGTYSFQAYENGIYTITVTDEAGNQTEDTITVGKIDRDAPTVSAEITNTVNPSGYYTDDSLSISITASDNPSTGASGLATYQLVYHYTNGDNVYDEAVNFGSGTSVTATTSRAGTYDLEIVVTDVAGNSSFYTISGVHLENGNPIVTIPTISVYSSESDVNPTSSYTSSTWKGEWTDSAVVELYVESGMDSSQKAYFQLKVDDGQYIDIRSSDLSQYGTFYTWDGTTATQITDTSTTAYESNGGTQGIMFRITAEGSHTYTFRATNISATERSGDSTVVTVQIDRTEPASAAYSISNAVGDNTTNEIKADLWYNTTYPTVTLTDVADTQEGGTLATTATSSAPHQIYYLLSASALDPDSAADAIKNDENVKSTSSDSATVEITEDGVWYLYYWTVDEAGNSSGIEREMIQADIKAPEFGTPTITDQAGNSLLNILTFGVFGNNGYKVVVDLSDNLSGVASMSYSVSGSDLKGPAEIQYYEDVEHTKPTTSMTCYATATFTISEEFTDGLITMTTYDYAGNSSEATLTAEKDGEKVTKWTYTKQSPTVTVTWQDSTINDNGWITTNSTTVYVKAEDSYSGLRKVSYQLNGGESTDILEQSTTEGLGDKTTSYVRDATEGYLKLSGLAEGETKVTVTAVSNADNSKSADDTIKVDTVKPGFESLYDTSTWTNSETTVSFRLTDATSGMKKDSIKVYSVAGVSDNNPADGSQITLAEIAITGASEGVTAGEDVSNGTTEAATSYDVSFTVTANGYYYIVAEDMAGNKLEDSWITVSNVDTTTPETPTITIAPTPADGDNSWYKTLPTVTFTVNTDTDSFMNAEDTLHWQIKNSDGEVVYSDTATDDNSDGTISVSQKLEDDGVYTLIAWTTNAAGSYDGAVTAHSVDTASGTVTVKTSTVKTISVDTTVPTISGVSESPAGWTNGNKTITFTVTDATSGTDANLISVSYTDANGQTASANPTVSAVSGQENTYQFTATENGTYTITAKDMAGNSQSETYAVTYIDKTAPAEATVTVDSADVKDGYWYYSGDEAVLTIAAPTQPTNYTASGSYSSALVTDEAAITTYYKLWNTSDTSASDPGYTSTQDEVEEDLTDGIWTLMVYTEDDAGNASSEKTYTIKVDKSAPTVCYTTITVTDKDKTVLESIANFFGFGNYFGSENGITVTLSGTDVAAVTDYSTIASAYYQLSGESAQSATVTEAAGGTFTFSFDLSATDLSEEKTITVWTVDEAGNTSEKTVLVALSGSTINGKDAYSTNWMIDTEDPTIAEPVFTLNDATVTKTTSGYYINGRPTMTVAIGDSEASGLYKVESKISATDENGEAIVEADLNVPENKTFSYTNTENKTDDYTYSYTFPKDGTYTITLTVTDNAGNTAEKEITVQVDSTASAGSFSVGGTDITSDADTATYFQNSTWLTDIAGQTVSFELTDAFSMVDVDTIVLTQSTDVVNNVAFTVDEKTNANTVTGSFTITENGTYTLTWYDVAGNKSVKEIKVTNVDIAEPEEPVVTVSGMATGNYTDATNTTRWYNATDGYPTITIDPTNLTTATNASYEYTKYIWYNTGYVWYTGQSSVTTSSEVIFASTDSSAGVTGTNPAINADGIWQLYVWNADAAGHTTDSVLAPYTDGSGDGYTIYVDTTAPAVSVTDSTEIITGTTANDVTLTFTLTDTNGSGVNTSALTLVYKETANSTTTTTLSPTINTNTATGVVTVTYTISRDASKTNGYYTLSYEDNAGNKGTLTREITKMDSSQVPSATVTWAASTATGATEATLSTTQASPLTKNSPVYLHLAKSSYSGAATLTYSATLTAPDGSTTNYTDSQIGSGQWTDDLSSQEGLWMLHMKTETNAAGTDATERYEYILIDKTEAVITAENTNVTSSSEQGVSGNPTAWTNDVANKAKITFYVTDPTDKASDSAKTVSGVTAVKVTTSDGKFTLAEPTENTADEDKLKTYLWTVTDGAYSFYALQNGTYEIETTDGAGNTSSYEVVVTYIDTTAPAAATVSITGTDGTQVDNTGTSGWWKIEASTADSDKNQITITAQEQAGNYTVGSGYSTAAVGDETMVTTWYKLWAEGADESTATAYSNVLAANGKWTIDLPEGKWNLKVWTVDDAGNETETSLSKSLVYVDETAPSVDNTGITITTVNGNTAATVLRYLTFGNFFNEAIQITIPVTDTSTSTTAVSGAVKLYYKVTDDKETAPSSWKDPVEINSSGNAVLSFTDEDDLNGYIWVYAEDAAGNTSTPIALYAYQNSTQGSNYWLIDTAEPSVSVSLDMTPTVDSSGWYNNTTGYPTVNAYASDGTSGSGINLLEYTIGVKERDTEDAQETKGSAQTAFSLAEQTTQSIVEKKEDSYQFSTNDGDGVFSISYKVTDNVDRTGEGSLSGIKIDMTAPKLIVSAGGNTYNSESVTGDLADYFDLTKNTTWTKDAQLVSLSVSDATSGVASLKVIATDGGTLKKKDDNSTYSEIDYTIDNALGTNTGEFYICSNGTYTVTLVDIAGNKTTYDIVVTNVDTTNPDDPEVDVDVATANSYYNATTEWYYGTAAPEITITAADAAASGESDVTTYYKLWNTTTGGTEEPADATPFDGTTQPTIAADGVYYLVVYAQDDAGNVTYANGASSSSPKVIKVDIDTPTSTITPSSNQPTDPDVYTDGSVKVDFVINDGNGSGIDADTLKLTWKEDSSSQSSEDLTSTYDIKNQASNGDAGKGTVGDGYTTKTISFTIEAGATYNNGVWTLSYTDLAGNTHEESYTVDRMDATAKSDIPLPTPSMAPAATYTLTLNEGTVDEETQLWYNGTYNGKEPNDDQKLSFTQTAYTGASSITTTVKIVDPSGNTEKTYTVTNDGKAGYVDSNGLYSSGFSGFDQEGKWTVTVSAVNGSGVTNEQTYIYYIDRTAPELSGLTGNPIAWTSSAATISFKVTDPTTNATDVSGVQTVSVAASQNGTLDTGVSVLTKADDGTYSFKALSNGVYTITMVDNTGNTSTYDVTVTYIDSTAPALASVSIDGTEGTQVGGSTSGWWKIEASTADSDKNQIQITALEQATNYDVDGSGYTEAKVGDTAKVTTYYKLWAESETKEPDAESGSKVLKQGETWTIDLPEGKWNLKVWTEDDAGNTSKSSYQTLVYVDETVPVINNAGIEIEEVGTSLFEVIGNILTFGNFFNVGIKITLPVTDVCSTDPSAATSGAKYLYYALTTTNEKPDASAYSDPIAVSNGTASITIEDTTLLNGWIWVYAEDGAGNKSDPFALKAYQNEEAGDDYWMIDLANPMATVTVTDQNGNAKSGWFNAEDAEDGNYPVVVAVLWDSYDDTTKNVSGINSITRKIQKLENGEYKDVDGTETTVYSLPTQIEEGYMYDRLSMESYMSAEGSYKVLYTVTDNSGRTVTGEREVLIDTTAPTVALDPDTAALSKADPAKDPQKIVVTATDTVSGVATIAITTENGSLSLSSDGSGASTSLTLPDGTTEFYVCDNGTYTVTVTDAAGNSSQTTLVVENMDLEAPVITGTDPEDGETAHDYKETTLTLTFNEEVKPVAGTEITLTVDGTTYTYTLNGDETVSAVRDESTGDVIGYEVELDLSKFTDEDGNTPTYTEEVPVYVQAEDEDGKPLYDEDGNPVYVQAEDGDGNPIYETVTCLDASTDYVATVPAGAFKDVAGNPLETEETISFTTMDADEDDPWMAAKTLTNLELAGLTESGIDRDNVIATPDYDEEVNYYTVYLKEGVLTEDYQLSEDLIVLADADEVESCEVTADVINLSGESLTGSLEYDAEYGGFVISADDLAGVQGGYCYVRVTTNNHGNTNTYYYLVSIGGVTETEMQHASADNNGETVVKLVSGTLLSALRSTVSDYAQDGSKVVLQFLSSVPRESAIATEKSLIESLAVKTVWANKQLYYYDLSVNLIADGEVISISELDNDDGTLRKAEINITLAPSFRGQSSYAVFSVHNGSVKLYGTTTDGTGNVVLNSNGTLTIRTGEFSVYAVTGPDVEVEETTPTANTTTVITKGGSGSSSSTETVYVTNTETVVTYVPSRSTGSKVKTTSADNGETVDTGADEELSAGDEDETAGEEKKDEDDATAPATSVGEGLQVGLALLDLLFLVGSIMTAEYLTLKQKKKKKVPNDILCLGALILFFVTQPLHGIIARVDRWTPVFAVIFAVQLVITVLKFKSDAEEAEAEAANAENK